jgi:PAS domain S-box-containing protein
MAGWLTDNTDYLYYSLVGLIVFAGLEVWLRRRAIPGHLPRWVWPALVGLLAGGWFLVDEAGDAEHARIQSFLQGVAPTYAQEFERMGHARITLATAPDDPVYLAMIEALLRWKKVNPTVADIYTYRQIDGQVRLMVDAETDYNRDGKFEGWREQRVPIGKEYKYADPAMLQALQGKATFSPEPVRDEWGVWVSAQVPLHDAQGKVEGALGVDYPADAWLAAIEFGRQRMQWFLAIPLLILGFSGSVTGVMRAELAARQAVEAKLRESEARLRTAIDNLPCDFWVMDRSLRYTVLNAASREHWGDNTGRSLDELKVAQTTRAEWGDVNQRAFAGEVVRHEVAYTLGGRLHHYLSIVAPVKVDGKVTAILGVNFDITDRVEGEAALRKSEEKLALHVRQTPLAVIEWNLAFRVTGWNPAAERIFGYTAAEAIGRPAVGLIVEEKARTQVERIWAALLTHKGGTRATNENITKDGRVIHCEWYNAPLVDASGAVIAVASSVQDVTDRDALEKQLRRAQKMESIGQLAGGVAHEFNNLLTPMLVQADIISFQYAQDEKLLALMRPIQDAIQQAAQLNQRILAVGRRAAEQRTLQPLGPLIENALALLRPSLDRRIELSISLQPGLGPLLLERANIMQIVMNLVLNARDTLLEKLSRGAPAGWVPRLTIATSLSNSANRRDDASSAPFAVPCQKLTITDNGMGIPAESRAQVFEPFFTTKEPGQGTGLGLAVVWNVVHGLGGWIEFDSGLNGEGTTFSVYLPLPDAAPSALVSEVPAPVALPEFKLGRKSANPKRVLLAEDNALVSETFTALLGSAGHTVTATQDGAEAWELFQRRGGAKEFDIVLADYNMPRLNGTELLQRIKSTGFTGRVVIVSGYLAPEKLDELIRLGADAVMKKPFTPGKLLTAIEG